MGKAQHVIPHEGKWAVRGEGNRRATSVHDTRADAVEAARRIADSQRSEVLIHEEDTDPVVELLDQKALDLPEEVQREMLARLKAGLDEHRMSPRALYP